jgi:hypothetical protein
MIGQATRLATGAICSFLLVEALGDIQPVANRFLVALCKNEIIFLAQADLHRLALGNVCGSLVLFRIGATRKELAWQAR